LVGWLDGDLACPPNPPGPRAGLVRARVRPHQATAEGTGLLSEAIRRAAPAAPRRKAERAWFTEMIQVCLQCGEECVHGRSAHTPAEREAVQGECAGQTSANGQMA